MTIWTRPFTLAEITAFNSNTAAASLGIEYTEIGDDYLVGRMPVDARTVQPWGILHGGASVLLAETLGSIAAGHCLRGSDERAVGLEINANPLRPVRAGTLTAVGEPIHRGRTTQVWQISISDEQGRAVCVSRCTLAVVDAAP